MKPLIRNQRHVLNALFKKPNVPTKKSNCVVCWQACPSHQLSFRQMNFHTTHSQLAKKNLYDVLGVGKNATKDEIKKAFFQQAKKYHPDVCKEPDAKEKFAELNNAYQILKDDDRRKTYDMTGSQEAAEQGGYPGGGGAGFAGGMSAEDIFNQFFKQGSGGFNPFTEGGFEGGFGGFGGGGRSGVKMPQKGQTTQRRMTVTLQDVVFGATKQIRLQKAVNCSSCEGTGEDKSKKAQTCPSCHGSGTFSQTSGFMLFQTTCPTCYGTGKLVEKCSSCKGKGHSTEWKDVEITIPAGILSGSNLRIRGYGGPGIDGGPPGDLLLRVDVQNHPSFQRDRNDLEIEKEIPLSMALLGGETSVLSLKGEKIPLTVPPGTQHLDKIVLRGLGITPKNRTPGNLNVIVKITIPRELNEKQRELIEQFAQLEKSEQK